MSSISKESQEGLCNLKKTQRETLKALISKRKKEMQEKQDNNYEVFDPYSNVSNSLELKRKDTGIAYDPCMLDHECIWDRNYPENPGRLSSIMQRLEALKLPQRCVQISNIRGDIKDKVISKHSEEVFDNLRKISESNDPDLMETEAAKFDAIYFNNRTFHAACESLSNVLNLVKSVADGTVQNGMAFVRPPGHHAMHNEYCGYCYFNNVAIAADMCINDGLAKKILIVDYDVHHGQGTQQMFYDRKDVLYFSIHRYEHGMFWPNLLESNYNFIGKDKGLGYNINVPLNETGLGDDDYLAIIFNILLPTAYEFNPDLVIVSAGYDAALGCPEGRMEVTPGFYAHLITLLSGLANGKIAVCLEGGYFPPSLAEGAAMTLKALLGDPCPILSPVKGVRPSVVETINNIRSILYDHWKCFRIWLKPIPNDYEAESSRMLIKYFGQPEKPPYQTRSCYPVPSNYEQMYYSGIIDCLQKKYEALVKRPVCFVHDEMTLHHKPKEGETERPEKPERIKSIIDMFSIFQLHDRCLKLAAMDVNFSSYGCHEEEYLDMLMSSSLPETTDVYHNHSTPKAIKRAVASLLTVVENVMNGSSGAGVAIIRPPGHHAEHNKAMGYCFINNIALAAKYVQQKYQQERILIVDFDVHHGNGTQNLFYSTNKVMYVSIHRYDDGKFFPSKTTANYTYDGFGLGQGYNINIPLSHDKMGNSEYLAIFHSLVLPIAYSYSPDVILVSSGFDAGINDPLGGGYHVSPETFGHFIQLLRPLAGGKLILALEGGYNLTTTSYGMTICTKTLLGDPVPLPEGIYTDVSEHACNTIRNVSKHFKQYWPILSLNTNLPYLPVLCKPTIVLTEEVHSKNMYKILDIKQAQNSNYVEEVFKKLTINKGT